MTQLRGSLSLKGVRLGSWEILGSRSKMCALVSGWMRLLSELVNLIDWVVMQITVAR